MGNIFIPSSISVSSDILTSSPFELLGLDTSGLWTSAFSTMGSLETPSNSPKSSPESSISSFPFSSTRFMFIASKALKISISSFLFVSISSFLFVSTISIGDSFFVSASFSIRIFFSSASPFSRISFSLLTSFSPFFTSLLASNFFLINFYLLNSSSYCNVCLTSPLAQKILAHLATIQDSACLYFLL